MKKLFTYFLALMLLVTPIYLLSANTTFAQDTDLSDYSYTGAWSANSWSTEDYGASGMLSELLAVGGIFFVIMVLLGLGTYIYKSLAFSKIAEKLNYEKKWFAWVPILNTIMIFELGDQNPMLLFLTLIPGIGGLIVMVFSIIAIMNIAEKRGFDKMLGLLTLVPVANIIVIGYMAWKEPK